MKLQELLRPEESDFSFFQLKMRGKIGKQLELSRQQRSCLKVEQQS
jgi:hypothetical protein